jgi:hypothetical protein
MSKLLKSAIMAIGISSMAISPAWADHYGHGGGGWGWWGFPALFFGTALAIASTAPPVYYPAPAYYPAPQPVYVQPTVYASQAYMMPPVPVAQMASAPSPVAQQQWWYYCKKPLGYYPYVQTCPTGWTPVSPVPPGQ